MAIVPLSDGPSHSAYDVVVIGGAVMGSSVAWHLSADPAFDGSVLVVERDPTYEFASTTHTNSCMRQQYSSEINIRIGQFAAEFVRSFRDRLGGDPEIPDIAVNHFGYMYLAADEGFASALRRTRDLQVSLGAATRILLPSEIAAEYPFYNLDDIICGSHNPVDEGWFDSATMFQWLRQMARRNGVEYVTNEVVGVDVAGDRAAAVTLASGESVACGHLVNAAGPRAARVAEMVGLELPVEPRKRYTWIFDAAEPLERDLPLTIDPSGVHVRSDGAAYMTGCTPDIDPAVDHDDFAMEEELFESKVWPVLVRRIPAFERLKVTSRWAGHYAYNTLDHNAVVGPHHRVGNFVFVNGFSGHGIQQAPAMGRGVSELITHGSYRTLDLTPLGHDRIIRGEPFIEDAVI